MLLYEKSINCISVENAREKNEPVLQYNTGINSGMKERKENKSRKTFISCMHHDLEQDAFLVV